jgi:hypothetical protein
MNLSELKQLYNNKLMELDVAMEMGKSRKALLQLYKELKELQYKMLQAEVKQEGPNELA